MIMIMVVAVVGNITCLKLYNSVLKIPVSRCDSTQVRLLQYSTCYNIKSDLNDVARYLLFFFFYMMIFGSKTEAPILLCGKTIPPLTYSSSLTITSSPSTDTFSILTH